VGRAVKISRGRTYSSVRRGCEGRTVMPDNGIVRQGGGTTSLLGGRSGPWGSLWAEGGLSEKEKQSPSWHAASWQGIRASGGNPVFK